MTKEFATGPYDGRRDVERAVAELAERLPGILQPLAQAVGLVSPVDAGIKGELGE